jgi:outer membrane protein assembly factor BamE (lipoprotein component of BamABCDE complex)
MSAIVALGLLAGACSPTVVNRGYRMDESTLAQIVPGVTSRDEVATLLGSPSSTGAFNGERWYYISQRTEQKTFYLQNLVSQNVVEITFDGKGIVQDIKKHDLQQAQNVVPDPDKTPAPGSDLTAMQEFFGNLGRFNPSAPSVSGGRSTSPGSGVPGG